MVETDPVGTVLASPVRRRILEVLGTDRVSSARLGAEGLTQIGPHRPVGGDGEHLRGGEHPRHDHRPRGEAPHGPDGDDQSMTTSPPSAAKAMVTRA